MAAIDGRAFSRSSFLIALSVAAASWVGCRSSPPARAPAVAPRVYTPEDAALLNDLFRPELFGYPGIGAPEADSLLRERVRHAQAVVPARVVTVTLEWDGQRRTYSVVVTPTEPPLLGQAITGATVTLRVAGNSPMFEMLEGAGAKWTGTRLLLFLRFYQDGPHFHGTVDTPAVRAAVLRARIAAR